MQPVLEPGTPVVEGAFMFMGTICTADRRSLFSKDTLMEVELVGFPWSFGRCIPRPVPHRFDISLSDRNGKLPSMMKFFPPMICRGPIRFFLFCSATEPPLFRLELDIGGR